MHDRPRGIYLSPTASVPPHNGAFGYLFTPRSYGAGIGKWIEQGAYWALDNDCFNDSFDEARWCKDLGRFLKWQALCLFVVIPDVVYNAPATLERFKEYAPLVKALGYPVALVTQDGMAIDDIPWDDVDTLFIGGTDEHKLGREAQALIKEAHRLGKWVHIGRVNSVARLKQFCYADSWDGTDMSWGPNKKQYKYLRAVMEARGMQMFMGEYLCSM